MSEKPVIRRYISAGPERLQKIMDELKRVVENVSKTRGECNLELREDYLDIYYRGCAVAKVAVPLVGSTYVVTIHSKFLVENPTEPLNRPLQFDPVLKGLSESPHRSGQGASPYQHFEVDAKKLPSFFRATHIEGLCRNIRRVGHGEEIAFEQRVVTDNPPSDNLIIIDRQVREHGNRSQMDLLALVREDASTCFRFLILELKLGRNKELESHVALQLEDYVRRVREHIGDFVACYQKNYEQKRAMAILGAHLPERITIDPTPDSVSGMILVGGYSQIGDEAVARLREAAPDVRVHQFTYRLPPELVTKQSVR